MADIVLKRKAYVKPLLHAAKYPHCAVNGVLLAEQQKHKEDKVLKLVDAVPLLHTSLTLTPMIEVALCMIDSYCQLNGLTIAGYYQANEKFSDSSPGGTACQIADKIRDNCGDACLLMVDNNKVFADSECAYEIFTNADSKWKKSEKRITIDPDAVEVAGTLISSRAYRDLVDFDNHFDDISLDWRNLGVEEQIAHCT